MGKALTTCWCFVLKLIELTNLQINDPSEWAALSVERQLELAGAVSELDINMDWNLEFQRALDQVCILPLKGIFFVGCSFI